MSVLPFYLPHLTVELWFVVVVVDEPEQCSPAVVVEGMISSFLYAAAVHLLGSGGVFGRMPAVFFAAQNNLAVRCLR